MSVLLLLSRCVISSLLMIDRWFGRIDKLDVKRKICQEWMINRIEFHWTVSQFSRLFSSTGDQYIQRTSFLLSLSHRNQTRKDITIKKISLKWKKKRTKNRHDWKKKKRRKIFFVSWNRSALKEFIEAYFRFRNRHLGQQWMISSWDVCSRRHRYHSRKKKCMITIEANRAYSSFTCSHFREISIIDRIFRSFLLIYRKRRWAIHSSDLSILLLDNGLRGGPLDKYRWSSLTRRSNSTSFSIYKQKG